MPNKDNKILKYSHGEKSVKAPAIIYAELECLLEKMHSCQNYPKKSYTETGYLIFTHCSFDSIKTNLIVTEVKIVWKGFVRT